MHFKTESLCRREAADFNEIVDSDDPEAVFDENDEDPEFFQGGPPKTGPTEQDIRAEQEAAGPW